MFRKLLGAGLAIGLSVSACKETPPPAPPTPAPTPVPVVVKPPPSPSDVDPGRLASFQVLPTEILSADNPVTEPKVALGQQLFFEKRLSKNQDLSCNSCHALEAYGVDGKVVSTGHKKQKGTRNAPSVYNAAVHVAQFWDGRAATVEEQAKEHLTDPLVMASDEKRILAVLTSMPEYVEAFKQAFPDDQDALTFANVGKAIGAFERRLVTPGRWDRFLGGDKMALTDDEKKGFNAFVDAGCLACHSGAALGGTMFQKAGLIAPWPNQKDQGRFEVTKEESDKMMFKTPSLRDVAKTAPYFHDGSVASLDEAVKVMAKLQLGKDLKDAEVKSISAFLAALTGDPPTDLIKEPKLPASTKTTPKPDPK